jgi:hypothetical protein
MKKFCAHVAVSTVLGSLCFLPGLAQAQVNVTTFHNDNSRTGQNTQEIYLTPSNVNYTQFGKLFSVGVDADVYAQPLYLYGVSIAGGTHNVVYVVTENDSVYAIDADSGTVYAQVNLIPSGGSIVNSSSDLGCSDMVPTIGISGTPVIDTSTGTMYLVATSKVNGSVVQYFHALNVTTLAESFGGPVLIQASAAGTATDGNGSTVTFVASEERQRAALLLENGHVLIAWGAYCDDPPYHGWVMSYNASTLVQEAVFNDSPNGAQGGIWIAGGGLAADSNGNIFFPTGNGTWNGTTDYGDSILKLGPPSGGTFPVLDYFTPWDQGSLYTNDKDVASGGLILLPTLASGQQLLAQEGKLGTIVLLDRNNMGTYCINANPACTSSDPQIVQEIVGASNGIWGSPAYWNGNLYWAGGNDTINAYSFNANGSGLISGTPTSQTTQSFTYAAPTPSISANGTADGILWALDGSGYASTCTAGSTCLGLYAYDATNLSSVLYNSMQAANNRDSPGVAVKYATPTIANGKVYVGTQDALSVFGLLSTPAAGIAASLTSADTIYGIASNGSAVTNGGLDGSGYAYSATLLGTSIVWNGSTFTLGAAGVPDGASSTTIALPAGNYSTLNLLGTAAGGGAQPNQTFVVTYSDGTTSTFTQSLSDWLYPQGYAGESIVSTMAYRLSITGTQSAGPVYLYGYSFALNSAKTVASITLPSNRDVVVFAMDLTPAVTPTVATPTFSPSAGAYSSAQSVSLSDGTSGATIYYTTNGSTPTTSSSKYSAQLSISATTKIEAIAVASGYTNSAVASATYTITSGGTTPVSVSLTGADDVYGIANTGSPVSGGGLDGAGYAYSATLLGTSIVWNGSAFTLGAAGALDAASSTTIALPAGSYSTLNLLGTAAGGGAQPNQTIVVTYSDGSTSTFTQSLSDWLYPQGYAGETVVSTMAYRISITGAQSTGPVYLYGYSFALNSAKTVASITLPSNRAVVVFAMDLTPVASVAQTPAATPTFSPAAGTYTTTQSVSLSDSTSGATIYYTTNGSTPTTNSSKYSAPLPISTTTTINAIAVASGYTNSVMASATYTIAVTGTPVSVSLTGADDMYGIANTGAPVSGGGLDGSGYAYSATLLGTSIVWNGSTFTLGAAGALDAASSTTITLPAGNYSTLNFLGTAAGGGNQLNQTFIVTYSDGTTSTFTQSLSDWFTPQGYAGETTVLTMAYRISITGATSPGPCYLYGYSFALNSAKTVASITLPSNSNVVVLAMDLTPASGAAPIATAATPTFSPAPGTYSSTQTVSLSDSTTGATIYYTTNGSTPTTSSSKYSAPLPISTTTTINAVAVASGYNNSVMASATYTITVTGTPVNVSLTGSDDVYAIANAGSPVSGGGLDGAGYAYAATLLGTSIVWNGSTFTLGAAGALDAASSTTITLPAGNYSTLNFLGTAAGGGNQPNQTFIVTYSDGSTTSYTQGLSDWLYPQGYAGEATVLTMAYRISITGATSPGPCYLFGYSFALNSTKTVASITLPNNRSVVVLGIDLTPAPPLAATPGFSPAAGTYTTTQSVSLSDSTPGATIYYTTNGSTPTTSSSKYSAALSISATTTINAIAVASGYTNSAMASATYTITPTAATPGFSPAAGTYTSYQEVSLSDSTPGATIYYTTNGSTPTTSSSQYGSPLLVFSTTTISAIAVASGYNNSAVGSATYTITFKRP